MRSCVSWEKKVILMILWLLFWLLPLFREDEKCSNMELLLFLFGFQKQRKKNFRIISSTTAELLNYRWACKPIYHYNISKNTSWYRYDHDMDYFFSLKTFTSIDTKYEPISWTFLHKQISFKQKCARNFSWYEIELKSLTRTNRRFEQKPPTTDCNESESKLRWENRTLFSRQNGMSGECDKTVRICSVSTLKHIDCKASFEASVSDWLKPLSIFNFSVFSILFNTNICKPWLIGSICALARNNKSTNETKR